MIPIDVIHSTALTLMNKAAIDIPDDYLQGLQQIADTEDGDLSSFVLQAMLENYQAAKEDRRAMCGDTGCPRWYVKMGNEARIEGGPVALETALRRQRQATLTHSRGLESSPDTSAATKNALSGLASWLIPYDRRPGKWHSFIIMGTEGHAAA